ncbi:ParB family protein [Pantoea sp. FN0307]|uniref:ParB family protein n=1 Tax=Pantoea sp. FN0307 TaxID=3418560 RepID=UPI003CFB34F0
MSRNRKTIGRTFTPSTFSHIANNENSQIFTLSSGSKVEFTLVTVPAEEVEIGTFVVQEVNGRDQAALTPESLKDITRTLPMQQFFPAIGVRRNNKIEILDGSRRRAAAILCHTKLTVLVTEEALSVDDARNLAKDIQTAREHNIREVGLRLLALKNSGLSQKEIAESEHLSQAKVTRALQAAAVSGEMLSVFPVQSELSYQDYKALYSAEALIHAQGETVSEIITQLKEDIDAIRHQAQAAEDEIKDKLVALFRQKSASLTQPKGEETVVTSLWRFEDKNRFARKKSKGRMFSYEFNRLPTEVQVEIDNAVQQVLEKHLTK